MMVSGQGDRSSFTAPKLASLVARQIEDDVAAMGWPVGTVLGSEGDLLERFGVSRAVLREAIRILEHTGAARMRRGPGGGLVVSEPNREAVVTAMGIWFSYVEATVQEMAEVRRPLLTAAVRLASRRSSQDDTATVDAIIDAVAASGQIGPSELGELEARIVELADNPALGLFLASLTDLVLTRLANGRARLEPALTNDEGLAHLDGYRGVVEAISKGDGDLAARRAERLIDVTAGRLTDGLPRAITPASTTSTTGKLGERVARELGSDIESDGWRVGEVIGCEADLVERYDVSRAILREAVRILEHHGAVRTKRGPNGGLVVTAPDSGAIVRSARLLLEYDGVTVAHLLEARSVLEVASVRLAATRLTSESAEALRSVIAQEAIRGDSAEHFMPVHRALAVAAGNQLFSMFVAVMGELVPSRVKSDRRTPEGIAELSSDVHHAHDQIVKAVLDGDPELAERRMSRHLLASVSVLE